MILGTPLVDFLIRWAWILALLSITVLTPFAIKLFLPKHYRGFWKAFGDGLGTPQRATMTPLGMLICVGLVAGLSMIVNLLF